jgi:hypothetical protein
MSTVGNRHGKALSIATSGGKVDKQTPIVIISLWERRAREYDCLLFCCLLFALGMQRVRSSLITRSVTDRAFSEARSKPGPEGNAHKNRSAP